MFGEKEILQFASTRGLKNPNISCRLDYFLIHSVFEQNVKSYGIIPGLFSDHNVIELKMKI